ncbi:MAG: DHA2 family efflux MFS transporter permease subunit [Ardenticatenaceae bacterium]|nr:DHA2 family efflux MFS transporter permease subunit [Ardenticatenaceae bacterium]
MHSTTLTATQADKKDQRRWWALIVLALSLLLVIMDGTIVNVAIPSIQSDLGATLADVEWVNSIYSLIFAMTLILWGKLGDIYGRRRLFIAGLLVFGAGSMLSGTAVSIQMLIGMRVLQAVGAAMLFPTALAIVNSTFVGKERGIAFGIWGMTAGIAAALGPLLGGWVVTNANWRWGFYINVPIIILAIVGALAVVAESRKEGATGHLDIPGALLGGLGLGGIIFGLIDGQTYGWWQAKATFSLFGLAWPFANFSIIPFSLIGGGVLLALFIWYERRLEQQGREPLFEFTLFQYRSYRFGLITLGIITLGEFSLIFALSLFLQSIQGLTAWETGLAILPLALGAFFTAPIGGRLVDRLGAKPIVLSGMVLETAALAWLSSSISVDLTAAGLRLPLLLYGVGIGLATSQINNIVLADVPVVKSGVASAGSSTIRRVGSSLGIAIVGTILATTLVNSAKTGLENSQLLASTPAYTAVREQIIQKLDTSSSTFGEDSLQSLMPSGSAPINGAPASGAPTDSASAGNSGLDMAALGKEITTIFKSANATAVRNVGWVATFFVALGALSAIMLPNPDFSEEKTNVSKQK